MCMGAGIVFGLYNHATGNVRMNPPPADVVEPGDELLIIRPTSFPSGTYRPAPHKKLVNAGALSSGLHAQLKGGSSEAVIKLRPAGHPFTQEITVAQLIGLHRIYNSSMCLVAEPAAAFGRWAFLCCPTLVACYAGIYDFERNLLNTHAVQVTGVQWITPATALMSHR